MKTTFKRSLAAWAAAVASTAFAAGEATNVIFFLGDGMGPTTVTASRIYKYGETGKLTMETLPRTARIKTYSNDAQTTDSAPSMAAYMTGVKMNNEVISMSADTKAYATTLDSSKYVSGSDSTCPASGNGTSVPTLLELAKAAGKGTGAVTTTEITHATPAATYAHICHRDGANNIAAQAVPGGSGYNSALTYGTDKGVDVLLGGGRKFFLPTSAGGARTDTRDLTAELQTQGYTYVADKTAFDAVSTTTTNKLVGLFNSTHMDYELDRVTTAEPSLADMTEKAIKILQKNNKGFFLMVEGGRIDHALHGTNAKKALEDTIAFDDAIKRALGLVDLKNTLIVVTADHDHTMTFNGYAHKGNPILGKVTDIKQTTVTGAPVLAKAADNLPYTALVFGNGGTTRSTPRVDTTNVDTTATAYRQEVGIPLSSETHGGGDVMLMATGVGSSGFKGTMVNTKVFGLIKSALGL